MAKTKTYGRMGLTEWSTVIKSRGLLLHVHFEGGTHTAYGLSPARYTTSDPGIQYIIEHSDEFRNGAIKLLRTIDNGKSLGVRKERKVEAPTPIKKEVESEPKAALTPKKELRSVPVGGIEDAKEHLKEHYGIALRTLRSKADVVKMAASKGIVFTGI